MNYASTKPLILEALDLILPREKETVSDYALKHRWLANSGGGYVGRWRHDLVPYLVEPMDCLTSLDYLTVALVGPGQVAKTVVAENWLLESVGNDPADMLWYMQTDEGVEAYVKARINTMIDSHEILRRNLGKRSTDDSLHFKRFRSMRIEFLSAQLKTLINKSAPRIVADEIDAYTKDTGDVKALLDVRRQTFGRQSKLLAISHPDLATGLDPSKDFVAGIMAIYADSDFRMWYWPCPHCGCYSSPCPLADRYMSIEYPLEGTLDEVESGAYLRCPVNGCVVEDSQRREMNLRGRWIGRGQTISEIGEITGELERRSTAGFWIVGAMSPFILGGIGGLARARVKAEREREVSGEDDTLRQVIVKQWGFPYAPPKGEGSVDANDLAARSEVKLVLGHAPRDTRFITVAVDCQSGRFEFLTRAWGKDGESWVIDKGIIVGDPSTDPRDWDKLLELYMKVYPCIEDSSAGIGVRGMIIDSAGLPGVTNQAYSAWKRWRRLGHVKRYGVISGRDVWSIIVSRGLGSINSKRLSVVYPDTSRKAGAIAQGQVPVAAFNANSFKDDLNGHLRRAMPGPWFVHFPAALKSKEPPHVWFEQVVSEYKKPNGTWEKVNANARNEALDLMVMAHVCAHLNGLTRINWGKPPSWAEEWSSNSMVMAPTPTVAPEAEVSIPAPPSGPRVYVAPVKKSKVSKLA